MLTPGQGSDYFRHNGAGEMLVFSAADFEDFLEPRPDLAPGMEDELERVVRHLVEHRWPFRLHATYDESISRMLDVFEKVNRDIPFNGLHWFFDHAETVTQRNMDRIKELGGGIAVQHRMAFQGEYFAERYGIEATRHTPPVARMLETGIPVGLGTDATRVASYNPGLHCTGWSLDVLLAACKCTMLMPASTAIQRSCYGLREVPGSRVSKVKKVRLKPVSSPI